jgi:hypothetical protein
MKNGRETRPFDACDPAPGFKPSVRLTDVISLHAAFQALGFNRREGLVVGAGMIPKPCVDKQMILSVSAIPQQLLRDNDKISTLKG